MRRVLSCCVRLLVVCAPVLSRAADLPVDRNPGSYLVLGLRSAKVKSLKVEAPGCSVGVNCAFARVPGGCGTLSGTGANIAEPGRPVLVEEGRDCSIGDTIPGNGQCDLATGTYGALRIENHGSLVLGTGTTVLCSLIARSYVRITSTGPATILVPGTGAVNILN